MSGPAIYVQDVTLRDGMHAIRHRIDPERVNAVSPGATRTPLGKLAEPTDSAGALLFLSSRLAGHVTGQNLTVDGGLALTWPLALPGAANTE